LEQKGVFTLFACTYSSTDRSVMRMANVKAAQCHCIIIWLLTSWQLGLFSAFIGFLPILHCIDHTPFIARSNWDRIYHRILWNEDHIRQLHEIRLLSFCHLITQTPKCWESIVGPRPENVLEEWRLIKSLYFSSSTNSSHESDRRLLPNAQMRLLTPSGTLKICFVFPFSFWSNQYPMIVVIIDIYIRSIWGNFRFRLKIFENRFFPTQWDLRWNFPKHRSIKYFCVDWSKNAECPNHNKRGRKDCLLLVLIESRVTMGSLNEGHPEGSFWKLESIWVLSQNSMS